MTTAPDFIDNLGLDGHDWAPDGGFSPPFKSARYGWGARDFGFEVLAVEVSKQPTDGQARELWKGRQSNQAIPLALVVLPSGEKGPALIVGPAEADLSVRSFPLPQLKSMLLDALEQKTSQAASRTLREHLATMGDSPFVGLVNRGLFADHALASRARARSDWEAASKAGAALLETQGRELIEGLGFSVTDSTEQGSVSVLRAGQSGQARAIAVFLEKDESFDRPAGRFSELAAIEQAATRARSDNIRFVLMTRGSEIRLYEAAERAGVGRKDGRETYVQASVKHLADDELGFLTLIFSAKALADSGSYDEIMEYSKKYSADLSERLRDRVYNDVVPLLGEAVAASSEVADPDLEELYEQAMLILFRLLFVAYAEDRDLLPYTSNRVYHANSLKSIARELADRKDEGSGFEGDGADDLWKRVGLVWEAVDKGNKGWGVPAYNGGLFSTPTAAGASLAELVIPNELFGPPLTALLVEGDDPAGPVDFRVLAVRDFGTIYEGLLESSLSRAGDALTVDRDGNYVVASEGDEVIVEEGAIYHHNQSGVRKSTGSYFTKEFAVEHLLDQALEPAIDSHLERVRGYVDDGDLDRAGELLFQFSTADLAMGSAHFLVAAVDRIESRFADFLAEQELPTIAGELEALRSAALEQLGDGAPYYELDDRMVLRRMVARRCIYGVDRNPIAVELARLAVWVHTFVPGLPLSFLDHNLVCGDALTGIGTIDEAASFLIGFDPHDDAGPVQTGIFDDKIRAWLEAAREPLLRLSSATDATATDIARLKSAQSEALEAVQPVRDLFDLICSARRGELILDTVGGISHTDIADHDGLDYARERSLELNALHFPVAFPEVFMQATPGFSCLLGNPPWEKVHEQVHGFWALRFPGLRGLSSADQQRRIAELEQTYPALKTQYEREFEARAAERAALLAGPFPGMGSGHPDLFKAFAWRFWDLLRAGGSLGVVLPRAAISGSGGERWRSAILGFGAVPKVTTLLNKRHWVFAEVHPQFTIALIAVCKRREEASGVELRGPFPSYESYENGMWIAPASVSVDRVREWSSGYALPLLPTPDSLPVFLHLAAIRKLAETRPENPWFSLQGDYNATVGRRENLFHLDGSRDVGMWPVYGGRSFRLWEPDTGTYNLWADPGHVCETLQDKRENQSQRKTSPFYGLPTNVLTDSATLDCLAPRIAYRRTARATDTRTLIAALVPGQVVLGEQAAYIRAMSCSEREQAFLLGVLCSRVTDWYSRRFVETNVSREILMSLPIPNVDGQLRTDIELIAARLASPDERFEGWANAVGVECGPLNGDEKQALIDRLDALVAAAYGLNRSQVVHIFETFHEGWDYQDRLDATLAEFDSL